MPGPGSDLGRLLLALGLILALIGAALLLRERLPWLAALLSHLRLGRLPGDILVERPGFRLYLPLGTGLLLSVVLSLLLWLFRR